jgi:hypothetical protein
LPFVEVRWRFSLSKFLFWNAERNSIMFL